MQKNLLLFIALLFHFSTKAQLLTVSGIITNNKLEPLGLVSVLVKNSIQGTTTKADGTYSLQLEEGRHEIVFSMVGHKTQTVALVVKANYRQNIIMDEADGSELDEVVIKSKGKDRSEEIIKNVIRHKEEVLKAAGSYSCEVYIKATQYDSTIKKGKKKKNNPINRYCYQVFRHEHGRNFFSLS